MSRKPGNIARFFTNLKNSFFIAKQTSKHVGTDQFGNEYYEKIGDSVHNVRAQRYIKEVRGSDKDHIPDVPVEWSAWLRGRRKDPPTEQEIQRNHLKMVQTKLRAEKLENKFSGESDSEVKTDALEITETIVSNNPRREFPKYAEFEDSPGQKYNKEGNRVE